MTGFPWNAAMQFGFGVLRLSPQAFWAMTPRELASAVGVRRGLAPPPLDRAGLDELIRRYPDRRGKLRRPMTHTAPTLDTPSLKTRDLTSGANGFARAMTSAFTASVYRRERCAVFRAADLRPD